MVMRAYCAFFKTGGVPEFEIKIKRWAVSRKQTRAACCGHPILERQGSTRRSVIYCGAASAA